MFLQEIVSPSSETIRLSQEKQNEGGRRGKQDKEKKCNETID